MVPIPTGEPFKDRIELLRSHHDRFVRRLFTGFGLPLILRTEPTVFCSMVCTVAMPALTILRLWFGRSSFVLRFVLIALTLSRGIIVGSFDFFDVQTQVSV